MRKRSRKFAYYFGMLAEIWVVLFLLCKCYSILVRRYNSKIGEIDIIALHGKTLVFVEVKARRSGVVGEVLSRYQQKRIVRSALMFVAHNPQFENFSLRFDLVLVSAYGKIVHMRDAWC